MFVQIGDENVHLVRSVMDDVFGRKNFCTIITIAKTAGATSDLMAGIADYLVWYAKDKGRVKYRQLYSNKGDGEGDDEYRYLLMPDGTSRTMTAEEREDTSAIPQCRAISPERQPRRSAHPEVIHLPSEGAHFVRERHSIGRHPLTDSRN